MTLTKAENKKARYKFLIAKLQLSTIIWQQKCVFCGFVLFLIHFNSKELQCAGINLCLKM